MIEPNKLIVEWSDGEKRWYLKRKRHREDGPAIERPDGSKEWYLNGKRTTEEVMIDNSLYSNVNAAFDKLIGEL